MNVSKTSNENDLNPTKKFKSNSDPVLWFEILVNPSLLLPHLKKEKPDPTPIDLLFKFCTVYQQNDQQTPTLREIALKILSMKILANFNWDLQIMHTKLPLYVQIRLIEDLVYVTSRNHVSMSKDNLIVEDLKDLTNQTLFACLMWHRWIITGIVHRGILQLNRRFMTNLQNNNNNNNQQSINQQFDYSQMKDPNIQNNPAFLTGDLGFNRYLSKHLAESSIKFLNELIASNRQINWLLFDTFATLNDEAHSDNFNLSKEHNWGHFKNVSTDELHCQIYFDLGVYYFFNKQWSQSRENFQKSFKILNKLSNIQNIYFKPNELYGYMQALNESIDGKSTRILKKFYQSIKDGYLGTINLLNTDILTILNDNKQNQLKSFNDNLPIFYRELTELEITCTLESSQVIVAKDLYINIFISNLIRLLLDENNVYHLNKILWNYKKDPELFLKLFLNQFPKNLNDTLQARIRLFFANIIPFLGKSFLKTFFEQQISCILFSPDEIVYLKKLNFDSSQLTNFLNETNKSLSLPPGTDKSESNIRYEQKYLQRKIILTYNIQEIYNYSIIWNKKYAKTKPIWRINSEKWNLPIPLQGVVMSLGDFPLLQLNAYLLLVKGRELIMNGDYDKALEMYEQLDTQSIQLHKNTYVSKLWKMIRWEILLIKIQKINDNWLQNQTSTNQLKDQYCYFTEKHLIFPSESEQLAFINDCKACLGPQQSDFSPNQSSTVFPRTEIVEILSLFLLNMTEWEFLASLDKRWNYFELTTLVAQGCVDILRHKGSKKMLKQIWEMLLPIFDKSNTETNQSQQKRNLSQSTKLKNIRQQIIQFMLSLRHPMALTIFLTFLTKLFNLLIDDTSLELLVCVPSNQNCESTNLSDTYTLMVMNLWPNIISGVNTYDSKQVLELLQYLLDNVALKFYPNNVTWLRLRGDINYYNNFHEMALKCYLQSLIISSDYFYMPLTKSIISDQMIKRMIKCCMSIKCFTQAVILCQFFNDQQCDYTTAFQCLLEIKPGQCNDAMDAYYDCIWDVTILEYIISLHHRRGEEHRKREAIQHIGKLELNSNNSEEIKREASGIRKRRFMRAMCQQYCIKYPV